MYVGVILSKHTTTIFKNSVPHVCGGDPYASSKISKLEECSPCMRGDHLEKLKK